MGVVVGLGYGTAGVAVGDEVYGLTDQFRDGAAAEYVAVEARNVAPSRGPSTTCTRRRCRGPADRVAGAVRPRRLAKGQTVIIHGAGGAVGSTRSSWPLGGAEVIGTGRSRVRRWSPNWAPTASSR